jgi:hypothetical protein
MKVDDYIFEGHWEEVMGTYLVYDPDSPNGALLPHMR